MSSKIAFIGSAGIPNNYGGFEMFLESCAPELAKFFDRVLVTCDASRYQDKNKFWNSVERIFLPVSANGASSVLHDLIAFFAVFFRVDSIVVLGVSGGVFFPLFRVFCSLFSKRLIVNVDGVEWRRAKFSRSRRWFLFVSDRLAQWAAHRVIVDNEALRPFLIRAVQKSAVLIAYPGDHIQRTTRAAKPADAPQCLTICRIEPENNCQILIEAFAAAGCGSYVFVGNWNASSYGRDLRARYKHVKGLEMRDPVYDKQALATLRENCDLYLHGHSVGGTNPSLVEMLFYDCEILAFDCAFNRATAGDVVTFFADASDLANAVRCLDRTVQRDRTEVRKWYSRERICDAYARELITRRPKALPQELSRPTQLGSTYSLATDDDELVKLDVSQT